MSVSLQGVIDEHRLGEWKSEIASLPLPATDRRTGPPVWQPGIANFALNSPNRCSAITVSVPDAADAPPDSAQDSVLGVELDGLSLDPIQVLFDLAKVFVCGWKMLTSITGCVSTSRTYTSFQAYVTILSALSASRTYTWSGPVILLHRPGIKFMFARCWRALYIFVIQHGFSH